LANRVRYDKLLLCQHYAVGLKYIKREKVFTAALYYSHLVISFALDSEHSENSVLNKYNVFFYLAILNWHVVLGGSTLIVFLERHNQRL
jgi:hypothetical protein